MPNQNLSSRVSIQAKCEPKNANNERDYIISLSFPTFVVFMSFFNNFFCIRKRRMVRLPRHQQANSWIHFSNDSDFKKLYSDDDLIEMKCKTIYMQLSRSLQCMLRAVSSLRAKIYTKHAKQAMQKSIYFMIWSNLLKYMIVCH